MSSYVRTLILFVLAVTFLPAQTAPAARQKALDQACASGVLSPEECAQKRAQLNGTPQAASAGTQWHEPNGRYTITVPAGWQIDTSQGNLKITQGDSWANFNTTSGPSDALAAAQREAGQMQSMVSDWKVYNQGPYKTAAGHPAAGVSVTCTVPTKTGPSHRVMLFLAQSAGNNNYVTMTSSVDAPTGQQPNAALSQAFETVRFANE